jgi:hypothetical protein
MLTRFPQRGTANVAGCHGAAKREVIQVAISVNKGILLRHAGKDPEIRLTTGGTLVVNLSLATVEVNSTSDHRLHDFRNDNSYDFRNYERGNGIANTLTS